jgi:hypothetical protein
MPGFDGKHSFDCYMLLRVEEGVVVRIKSRFDSNGQTNGHSNGLRGDRKR